MEKWVEVRRMRFLERLWIHEIARRTGHNRKTVSGLMFSKQPPGVLW